MSTFAIENPCGLGEELLRVQMAGGARRLATMVATRRFSAGAQIKSEADRGLWFSAHVQTYLEYLERDLRQLSAISSLPDFQASNDAPAPRTGKPLNQTGPGARRGTQGTTICSGF
jgi:hypothetical protein